MDCLNSLCKCFINCWYKCTDKCYKKHTSNNSDEKENDLYLCNYPYCFKLTQWNNLNTNQFIKFRDKIYCSEQCQKLHQNMNYGTISDDYTCDYADL